MHLQFSLHARTPSLDLSAPKGQRTTNQGKGHNCSSTTDIQLPSQHQSIFKVHLNIIHHLYSSRPRGMVRAYPWERKETNVSLSGEDFWSLNLPHGMRCVPHWHSCIDAWEVGCKVVIIFSMCKALCLLTKSC